MEAVAESFWRPLLEASAQTLVGVVGSYAFSKALRQFHRADSYEGAMDFWLRGISQNKLQEGQPVAIEGLISPYVQLFPGDPSINAERWNNLYEFQGRITKNEFQSMEFYAGSDAALRVGSLNGESLVGIYSRYGFIGEGVVGVVPTSLLLKEIGGFFNPSYFGQRARLVGTLSLCPSQHGFVAQQLALRTGVELAMASGEYKKLPYINIKKIELVSRSKPSICSLLGSPWGITQNPASPYLVQYGHFSNRSELGACIKRIVGCEEWNDARVYFDDLTVPSSEFSFRSNFIE